jgi:DNA polymerase-3 subunit delta
VLIRSYISRSKRLIKLSDQYSKNKNLDLTISSYKPPIFWKEKDIIKKQLKIWNKDSLLNLIKELNKVELLIKKNVSFSKELIFDFLTNKCLD